MKFVGRIWTREGTSREMSSYASASRIGSDAGMGVSAAGDGHTAFRTTLCAHCGEPCDAHSVISDDKAFCCVGCRTVYELLRDHELCDYYSVSDDARGVSMKSANGASAIRQNRFASHQDYEVLDDPNIVRSLVSFFSDSRQRVLWHVPTLHCASCIWLLEQLDRFDSGILSSEVDILRKTVTVDIDPRATSLRAVAEEMARIGYAPVLHLEKSDNPDVDTKSYARAGTRGLYSRIGVAGFAAGNTMMIYIARYFAESERGLGSLLGDKLESVFGWMSIALSIPVLLYSASPWFTAAFAAIRRKRVTLDVPVALGILVLFVRSAVDLLAGTGEGYLDSFNGLVFFLLIGRLFQQKAFDALSFDRTYRSFFPLSVRVERNGENQILPIEQIAIGDKLLIRNAEVVPCETVLQSEAAYIDYSFVTGEALPVECTAGAIVHAGGRVIGRATQLIAMKTVSHSELSAMWGKSTGTSNQAVTPAIPTASCDATMKRRPLLLDISDVFGKWFTAVALVVAFVGAAMWLPNVRMAFDVFTAVLIIACPCALTLATPITLGTAMGLLGRAGIYLKHISVLLELPRITSVFFDKTGTLTFTNPDIFFRGRDLTEDEWRMVRSVAAQSVHPLSRAIASELQESEAPIAQLREEVGRGVEGLVSGHEVRIGASDFVCREGSTNQTALHTEFDDHTGPESAVYVSIDGELVGGVYVSSRVRPGMATMLRDLRERASIRLISGDTDRDLALLEPFFDREEMRFSCKPEDKNREIAQAQTTNKHVLMVGDGLNDAGAMERADVAVAISDDTATLVPACDVILRAESLGKLPLLLRYAKQLKMVILVSFTISVLYNILGLGLAVTGSLSPLVAAILMPVSSLTVIGLSVGGARYFGRTWRTGRSAIWA